MLSNVETWLEHMKMHFWAARVASERRAAFVQYHTDEEMQSVMWAMQVQVTDDYDGLLSALFEAFGVKACGCILETCAGCSRIRFLG
ncbi:hypothetical protein T12_12042 [Trichinella patagoniensis]|uniref:Uncharacterized protein n=1 Tax=Trichinella patagoniensis TaxID=990121 RepID=A0A0V0ZEQ3_9BILA|nr:hypothetical protein T12_12042 [Trichinella patagoniensis]